MIGPLLVTTGIGLILYGLYKWITINNDYFEKRNMVALKPLFLLGNTGRFFFKLERITDFLCDSLNQFPNEKLFGLFDFNKPIIFIRDPELVKRLTVKEFDNFTDHRQFFEGGEDLFSTSLVAMRGNRWRNMRSSLSPAFTGSKMRQMFELVCECAVEMADHLKGKQNRNESLEFDIKQLFRRYANDVIASCAFGYKVNSFEDKDNEFFASGTMILNFQRPLQAFKLAFFRMVPKIMNLLGIEFLDKRSSDYFTSIIQNSITMRSKQGIFRPDMINIIMQLKEGNLQKQHPDDASLDAGFATVQEVDTKKHIKNLETAPIWTDRELVAQCFLFFLAGFDTTSTLLSFAMYEIAINADVQEKLYHEIEEMNDNLGGKRIQYETLQKMNYMDQVISETLRKWPPALFTDRVCVKDFILTDENNKELFKFEKGLNLWIPIFAFHRCPQYFPNPEKFDPERFSPENRDSINPNAYLPFGIGPRNCIGSRFALMEIKAVLYSLLLNFEVLPTKNTQIPLKLAKNPAGNIPEKPISLEFKQRN